MSTGDMLTIKVPASTANLDLGLIHGHGIKSLFDAGS